MRQDVVRILLFHVLLSIDPDKRTGERKKNKKKISGERREKGRNKLLGSFFPPSKSEYYCLSFFICLFQLKTNKRKKIKKKLNKKHFWKGGGETKSSFPSLEVKNFSHVRRHLGPARNKTNLGLPKAVYLTKKIR